MSAKLLVPPGRSDQAIGGEISFPSQVYSAGIALWALKAVDTIRILPSSRAKAAIAVMAAVSTATGINAWRACTGICVIRRNPAMTRSVTRNHHFRDLDRRAGDAATIHQIAADDFNVPEHLLQIAGDRNLLDGIGKFAILDPESSGAARIIACHHINTEPDQFGDIESFLHGFDDV